MPLQRKRHSMNQDIFNIANVSLQIRQFESFWRIYMIYMAQLAISRIKAFKDPYACHNYKNKNHRHLPVCISLVIDQFRNTNWIIIIFESIAYHFRFIISVSSFAPGRTWRIKFDDVWRNPLIRRKAQQILQMFDVLDRKSAKLRFRTIFCPWK